MFYLTLEGKIQEFLVVLFSLFATFVCLTWLPVRKDGGKILFALSFLYLRLCWMDQQSLSTPDQLCFYFVNKKKVGIYRQHRLNTLQHVSLALNCTHSDVTSCYWTRQTERQTSLL